MGVRETGCRGELAAADCLRRKGYEILERNYRSRYGEIDLIARDGDYLVFVEVKTRGSRSVSLPREAVGRAKQSKLIRTALLYLSSHPGALQPRFDVVEVFTDGTDACRVRAVRHLPDAFSLPYA